MAFIGRLFSGSGTKPPEKYSPPDLSISQANQQIAPPSPTLVPPQPMASVSAPISAPAPLFSGMVVRAPPAASPPPSASGSEGGLFHGLAAREDTHAHHAAAHTSPAPSGGGGFSFMRETTTEDGSTAGVGGGDGEGNATRIPRRKVIAKKRTTVAPGQAGANTASSGNTGATSVVSAAPTTSDTPPSMSPNTSYSSLPSMNVPMSASSSPLPSSLHVAAPTSPRSYSPALTSSGSIGTAKTVDREADMEARVMALEADGARAVQLCRAKAAEMDSVADTLLKNKTAALAAQLALAERRTKLEEEQSAVLAALDEAGGEGDLVRAERLGAALEALAMEEEAAMAREASLTSEYRLALNKAAEAREAEARFQKELAEALSTLATKHETVLNKRKDELRTKETAETDRLNEEEERLARAGARLALDEKMLADDEREAEAAIASKTQPFELEKQMWAAKRASVRRDIDALQAQLRTKEAEETGYAAKVTNLQEDVDRITAKYRKTLTKTATARSALQTEAERHAAEKRLLDSSRAVAKETALKGAQEAQLSRTALNKALQAARTAREASSAAEAKARLGRGGEDGVALLESESVNTRQRREHLEAARATAKSATARLQAAEADSAAKRAAAAKLASSTPELEAAKKAAVAARNFKEAARLTSELKTAQAQAQELDGAQASLTAALEAARASASAAEREALVAEEELRVAVRSEAADKLHAIATRLGRLSVSATSERALLRAATQLLAHRSHLPVPPEPMALQSVSLSPTLVLPGPAVSGALSSDDETSAPSAVTEEGFNLSGTPTPIDGAESAGAEASTGDAGATTSSTTGMSDEPTSSSVPEHHSSSLDLSLLQEATAVVPTPAAELQVADEAALEAEIVAASEGEDFEAAARLQERLDGLRARK